MTSYFERKSAHYILRVTITIFIVLGLIVTLPYWAYVLGMIGIALIWVSAFVIIPLFFIYTMLSGQDYKERD